MNVLELFYTLLTADREGYHLRAPVVLKALRRISRWQYTVFCRSTGHHFVHPVDLLNLPDVCEYRPQKIDRRIPFPHLQLLQRQSPLRADYELYLA